MLEEKEKRTWKVEHNSVLNSAVREGQRAKGIREEPMEIEKSYALIMLQVEPKGLGANPCSEWAGKLKQRRGVCNKKDTRKRS